MGLLTITVNNRDEAQRTLDLVLKGLDAEAILDEAAASTLNRIRTRFLQMVAPDGTPWTPSGAALRENRNTLLDTGRLFRSIQLYDSGPNFRTIGTDVPYAPKLQIEGVYGITREFLGLNQGDVDLVELLVRSRFEGI